MRDFEIIPVENCDHGVTILFDKEKANGMTPDEVRKEFPRGNIYCDKCGYYGVMYASFEHYIAGDW